MKVANANALRQFWSRGAVEKLSGNSDLLSAVQLTQLTAFFV